MRQFSAAVLGLGQVGQGYDYKHPNDALILTHATGFAYHDAFNLVAAVDPDPHQRRRFEKKFKRPVYPDVQSLISHHQPEVVSIAAPTALHYQVFQEAMRCQPRAVLCEKPIASRVKEAKQMLTLAAENQCVLAVNYIRRFEPGVLALKHVIQNGEVGEIYKGTVWYSKGLLNNGSHFVDLLRFLIGDPGEIKIINRGRKWDDQDPEPDVCIYFGEAAIHFLCVREECFSMGDMDLIGTQGKIRYIETGADIEIRKTQRHPSYPGYTILSREKQSIANDLKRYQWHVLDHLHRHLLDKTPLNSDGKSATETLEVIENIISLL